MSSKGKTPRLVEMKAIYPLWKTIWTFHLKLPADLPQDPSIPLLGIYPKIPHSTTRIIVNYVHKSFIRNRNWKHPISLKKMDKGYVVFLHNSVLPR